MSESQLPRLLRVREVAARLGIQEWRIYELVQQKKIPHVRIGRTLRFSEPALVAWLEAEQTNNS